MTKVLIFKVEIIELENKIWREIEIISRRTLADLVYAILASFESLAYHLFEVTYKGQTYHCDASELFDMDEIPIYASDIRLESLNLQPGDTLKLTYDFGVDFEFNIKYIKDKEFRPGTGNCYPKVTDGAGKGMIDDIPNGELKAIVDDIDIKGESDHYSISPYTSNRRLYDYRDYSLKLNDFLERDTFKKIKSGYES